jgi:2-isopropylmalate synthase
MDRDASQLIHDWNAAPSGTPPRVRVLDETLRDGLQSPSVRHPSLDEKKELLRLANRVGVDAVVLGLPGASPRACEEVAALASFLREEHLALAPVAALRTHPADIRAHFEACDRSGTAIMAGIFLGSSPMRLFAEGWELAELVKLTTESVTTTVGHGVPVMFITEDTTRSRPADLRDLYMAALNAGAVSLCLCDTVGHAEVSGVAALVAFAKQLITESGTRATLEWHGHNDRGLALANALAAAAAGVDRIHGACLGIGERVGNTALDQLLVNLELRGPTGRALDALPEYCRRVQEWCEAPLPANYPVMGSDAFRTATGVHAAAIMKALERGSTWIADRVYSAVPASMFGRIQQIEIGPMSGRHNVRYWLSHRHPEFADALRDRCIERILEGAKSARTSMTEEELSAIIADVLRSQSAGTEETQPEAAR